MNDLVNTGNAQVDTVANAAIPVALAIAAASSPQAAAAVAAIQAILPIMQAALKAHSAGQVSDEAIVSMWEATTTTIATTHSAWQAMNAAEAKAA